MICATFSRAFATISLMSSCPSCDSVIQKVHRERQRLYQIVWDKACDHMLVALQTPVSSACTHANFLTFLIQWTNLAFFHGVLPPLTPTRRAACKPSCAADYHSRVHRFVYDFGSYAVPIRLMHMRHHKQLEAVTKCCKQSFADLHCIPDFSMLIFAALNKAFFKNTLRMHRVRNPQRISAWVSDETRKYPNRELYRAWTAKAEVRPPSIKQDEAHLKQDEPSKDDVSIQFLDEPIYV